jgi:hypothetical protein
MDSVSGADRRRFLKLLALVGMSSAVAGTPLPAADAAPGVPAAAPPPADSAAAGGTRAPSEDARALAGVLIRRYPDAFDDSQIGEISGDLDDALDLSRRLRAVKLGNHEEPDFTFRA